MFKTGMSGSAKHALVVLAIMLSLANAKCFATCSPNVVAATALGSKPTKPVSGDCHKHSSPQREGHENKEGNSHEGKSHSCLHDALVTAATDTYNTSSLLTDPFPAAFGFSAVCDDFIPTGRVLISDLSPPLRLHPNLTIVIRV
jgi:hypothetical protein